MVKSKVGSLSSADATEEKGDDHVVDDVADDLKLQHRGTTVKKNMSDACNIVKVSDDAADDVSSSGSNSDEPIRKKQTANISSFFKDDSKLQEHLERNQRHQSKQGSALFGPIDHRRSQDQRREIQ